MALSDPRKLSLSEPESTILDSYHAGVRSHALTYSPHPLSALLPDSAFGGYVKTSAKGLGNIVLPRC